MRKRLLTILRELKDLTGITQYEKIATITDGQQAQMMLDNLLRPMIQVCALFPYIPEETKEKIIRKKIIEDMEFTGLNASKINKYLNSVAHIYYAESCHLETRKVLDAEPEELSPEVVLEIEQYKAQLLEGFGKKQITGVQAEIVKIEREERLKMGQKSVAQGYKPLTQNQVAIKVWHVNYLRENYDAVTKAKKPNWKEESEWLLDQGLFIENGELKEIK